MTADPASPDVRVRMYRQGLGDCFLVSFIPRSGTSKHMLIDCGTLGTKATEVTMDDVVQNIYETTDGRLDLLVATHEHKDHVSGFTAKRFDEFTVDRVWMAWTEDATDALANQLASSKRDLVRSVALSAAALQHVEAAMPAAGRTSLREMREGLHSLLDFVGDEPGLDVHLDEPFAAKLAGTVQAAMSYVTRRGKEPTRFLAPGNVMMPDWLPGVRFYVLGPPRDEAQLKQMGDHGSPDLYSMTARIAGDLLSCARLAVSATPLREFRNAMAGDERERFERRLAFDPRFRVEADGTPEVTASFAPYYDQAADWRRIDGDWLAAAGELALQLDSYTNNTSLVLAIELVADGRVLLFPADAQQGNWLSWHDQPLELTQDDGSRHKANAADLLARTVVYKVGHHASHNATVTTKGLELMDHDALIALIPVDRAVALNKGASGWDMPAAPLYRRLVEKTHGRVLRSDTGWPDPRARPTTITKAAWDSARATADVQIEDLYIDVWVR